MTNPPAPPTPTQPFAPGFHDTYNLGNVIGEGAFSKVYSATMKRPGPNQGLQVAVKCIERNNLPKEDEEDLLEEVSYTGTIVLQCW